jgi:protein tyrosine/serine phosphatase
MNFYNFPLDSMNKVTDEEGEWIDEALRIIADPAQQPVYIHCAHGKDRTGLVVALERVNQEEWAPKAARAEWIKYGHTRKSRVVTHDLDRYFFKVTSDNP